METLKLDWDGNATNLAIVTLNRPGALNAMNTRMFTEFLSLLREQAYNEQLRCMVITGAGERAFSTGGDLKERNGMTNDQWRHQHHLIEDMFEAVWSFSVPSIAAVEGFAYAGGCELALGTDFIVASETAEFALKEITRGIMPGGGGMQRLARSIGVRRASEMIYTGRAIKADQAYAWGLINRVAPAGQALATALEIAREIAASAPMAVRAAKVALSRGQDCDSRTAYALDLAAYNQLVGSEDRLEGIAAFNEKRTPIWKNR
ncbi:MAG TPA: enoyl-CoA hydratase-related protein [Candidatus Binataceae bacterium]|jgi:enoyl-CoA hydratase/carnithine racemase|nr:enoyl-CoA hydratase-related protein [Candidatus Binataceae bacterium]